MEMRKGEVRRLKGEVGEKRIARGKMMEVGGTVLLLRDLMAS
jgi:hypothetical protein